MLLLSTVVFLSLWTGLTAGVSKLVVLPCDQMLFENKLQLCLNEFSRNMESSGFRDGCTWPTVKRTYYGLKVCVDHWANTSWCKGVGSLMDDFFLEVHQTYFSECGRVQDPPLGTLILLVAPVVMATVFLPLLCVSLTTANKT